MQFRIMVVVQIQGSTVVDRRGGPSPFPA